MTNIILDREDVALESTNGLVMLNVKVMDMPSGSSGLSNNTIVSIQVIDQNDNRPVFEQPNITMRLQEIFVVGNALPERVQAIDKDSPPYNDINYEISGTTPEARLFFGVHEKTGVIILLSPLDFETKTRHEFVVEAIDANVPIFRSSQAVIINVMVPEVNITLAEFHHTAEIQENSPINHSVIHFKVTDNNGYPIMQNYNVTYSITNYNGIRQQEDFGLMNDTVNSVLIVYVKRNINREALPMEPNGKLQRILNITVSSDFHGSLSVNLRVTIQDQNDNYPEFSMPSYTFEVQERNDISISFGSVSATDIDFGINGSAGINFQVVDSVAFQVSTSGELRSIQSLDREELESYSFAVIASDGASPPLTSHAHVHVLVMDLNDNPPFFNPSHDRTFYVGEETEVNTVVEVLSVSDADSDSFGPVILYIGNVPSQYFDVHPDGTIVLIESLDRKIDTPHFFTVVAMDGGGMTATANVIIIVEDYNDNVPVFNPISTIFLSEHHEEDVPL